MSCFLVSLRGSKGFIMDAPVLWKHIGKGREVHLACVVIPLMGRFKGGTGSRYHLQAVVNKTASRLKVMWLMERLNDESIIQLQRNSTICCNEEGKLAQASHYQETFVIFLRKFNRNDRIKFWRM